MQLLKRRAALVIPLVLSYLRLTSFASAREPRFSSIAALRELVVLKLEERPEITRVASVASDTARIDITFGQTSIAGDITNLFNYFTAYPNDETDDAIERWIESIADLSERAVYEDNIVAVIRTTDYIRDLNTAGFDLVYEPLVGDLNVIYMVDLPNSMSPLSAKDVASKDLASLRQLALKNVKRHLQKIVPDATYKSHILYFVEDNTLLTPSLILIEEFWESVSLNFPDEALIAIPRKDQLFVFHPGKASDARRMIAITLADEYNLLSEKLYLRRNGKLMIAPG